MNRKSSTINERRLNALVIGKRYNFIAPMPSSRMIDRGKTVGISESPIHSASAFTISSTCCPTSSLPIMNTVRKDLPNNKDSVSQNCCANVASIDNNSKLMHVDNWFIPIPNSPRRSPHYSSHPLCFDALTSWKEVVPSPLTNQPLLGMKVPLHNRSSKLGNTSCLSCTDVLRSNGPQLTTGSYSSMHQLSAGVDGESQMSSLGDKNACAVSLTQGRASCRRERFTDFEFGSKNTSKRNLRTEQVSSGGVLPKPKLAWPSSQEKEICDGATPKTSTVKADISSILMRQTVLDASSYQPWQPQKRPDPPGQSHVQFSAIRNSSSSQQRKKKKKKKKKKIIRSKQYKQKRDRLEETTLGRYNVSGKHDMRERHSELCSDTKPSEQTWRRTKRRQKAWESKMKRSGKDRNRTHKSDVFSEKMASNVLTVDGGREMNSSSIEVPSEATIYDCQSNSSHLEENRPTLRDTSVFLNDIEPSVACTFAEQMKISHCDNGGRCEERYLKLEESVDKYTAILDSESPGQQVNHNSVSLSNATELHSLKTVVQLDRNGGARQKNRYASNPQHKRTSEKDVGSECRADTISQKLPLGDLSPYTQEKSDRSETEGFDKESSVSVSVECSSGSLRASGINQSVSACTTGREKQEDKICRNTKSNTCMAVYTSRPRPPEQTKSRQVCSLPMLCKALEERISCSQVLKSDSITMLTGGGGSNSLVSNEVLLKTKARDSPVEQHGLKDNKDVNDKSTVQKMISLVQNTTSSVQKTTSSVQKTTSSVQKTTSLIQKTTSSVEEEMTHKNMHAVESEQRNAQGISWLPFIHSLPEGTQEGCVLYRMVGTEQRENSKAKPVHSPVLIERPVSRPSRAAPRLGSEFKKMKQRIRPHAQAQSRKNTKRSSLGHLKLTEQQLRRREEIPEVIGDAESGKTLIEGVDDSCFVAADLRKSRNQSMKQRRIRTGSFPFISTETSSNNNSNAKSRSSISPISKSSLNAKRIPLPCSVINVPLKLQPVRRSQFASGISFDHQVENYSVQSEVECDCEVASHGRDPHMKVEIQQPTENICDSFHEVRHLVDPEEFDFFNMNSNLKDSEFNTTAFDSHKSATFASGCEAKVKDQINSVYSLKYLAFKALEVSKVHTQFTKEQEVGRGETDGLFSPDSAPSTTSTGVESAYELTCNIDRPEKLDDLAKKSGDGTLYRKSAQDSEPAIWDLEKTYETAEGVSMNVSPADVSMDYSGAPRPKRSSNTQGVTPSSASFHARPGMDQEENPVIRSILVPLPPSRIKPITQGGQQGSGRPLSVSGIYGRDSNRPRYAISGNEHIESPDLSNETSGPKQVVTPCDTSCDSLVTSHNAEHRTLRCPKPVNADSTEMDSAEPGRQEEFTAEHCPVGNSATDPQGMLVSDYIQLGGAKRSKTEVEFLKLARKRCLSDVSALLGIRLYSRNSDNGKVTPSWKYVLNSRNRRRVPALKQGGVTDATISVKGRNIGKVWKYSLSALPNIFDPLRCRQFAYGQDKLEFDNTSLSARKPIDVQADSDEA